jgi:hypothetical protein
MAAMWKNNLFPVIAPHMTSTPLARVIAIGILLIAPTAEVFAGAGVENGSRWPSRTIRYAICDCSKGDPKPLCSAFQCVSDVAAVRKALELWNDKAGSAVKLVERDPADKKNPYLLYVSQVSETAKATK